METQLYPSNSLPKTVEKYVGNIIKKYTNLILVMPQLLQQ